MSATTHNGAGAEFVLTTQKDMVKLPHHANALPRRRDRLSLRQP
jgi:tetraacyldisaccharide-1-P 4'-kinase